MVNKSIIKLDIAAWTLMGLSMIFVLKFDLLPGLLAGLLVFELVHIIAPYIALHLPGRISKIVAVSLLAVIIIGLLVVMGVSLSSFLRSESGSLTSLIASMAQIIEDSRQILPAWIDSHLPEDAVKLQQTVTEWLREHSRDLQFVGAEFGRHFAHVLIAMVIGGMIALSDTINDGNNKPFAQSMLNRLTLFGKAFRNIIFAQVRISAVNATLTGIYLAVILPLMGVHLPFAKTIIAITFIVGLLPVIGNLISNTIIVIVSMSQSLGVAIGSLIFLVVIHKLEYFLNARIIGGQIRASAWELLIAMVLMEAAFGIAGVVAAPVYYAYIKSELRERELI